MKKFLKTWFLFLPGFVLFYLLAVVGVGRGWLWANGGESVYGIPQLSYSQKATFLANRIQDADQDGPVDVLILGSSQAYAGMDVREFQKQGVKVLNLGSAAQCPVQTECLIRRYLSRRPAKTILWVISPRDMEHTSLGSTMDYVANGPNHLLPLKTIWDYRSLSLWNARLIRASFDAFGSSVPIRPLTVNASGGTARYIPGGSVVFDRPHYDTYVPGPPAGPPTILAWDPDPKTLRSFLDGVRAIRATGSRLIFVTLPVTERTYARYAPAARAEFETFIRKLGDYRNLHESLHLNDATDFLDDYHLNQSGSQAVFQAIHPWLAN